MADDFLKQIETAMNQDHEKDKLITLFNSLAVCYIRMDMPQHALLKLKELESIPGVSLNNNYDFLFLKAKTLYKLEKFRQTLDCCLKLKILSQKPNESLDSAISNLNEKVREEDQNLFKRNFHEKTTKRDSSVPRISKLVPDIIPRSSLSPKTKLSEIKIDTKVNLESFPQSSVLEPLFAEFDELEIETSKKTEAIPAKVSRISRTKNTDSITFLKELSERGVIKQPKYTEEGANSFTITCEVYHGYKCFRATESATNKKQAKHLSADAIVEQLKEAKVIDYN